MPDEKISNEVLAERIKNLAEKVDYLVEKFDEQVKSAINQKDNRNNAIIGAIVASMASLLGTIYAIFKS